MLQATDSRLHRNTQATFQSSIPGPEEQHTSRQNQILAALPLEVYQRLLPNLVPITLTRGLHLHDSGDLETHLYFPISGIISDSYVTEDGQSAGFALTGNEGAVGVALFLGGRCAPSQAAVLVPGFAYRLRADLLKAEFSKPGPLSHLLLRFTFALVSQYGQTAACNRHHTVLQQLCRLILSCLDRLPSNELAMRQEALAEFLGVRREGVTAAAGLLRKLGLISYGRGHIVVPDRSRLEAHACECYGVMNREYGRLLPGHREAGSSSWMLQAA